ncbi:MAG TPA: NarK family nitrate/nitrite MFS transporter [Burkholderiales bacterium]|nr:NarK family nitrate/nitrite MFS transporter [Burkholderiales bacterium]
MTTHPPPVLVGGPRRGRVLQIWTPEDKAFWESQGRAIANLNLWISIPALFLAFAVWMVWSAVVVQLPAIGFRLGTDELFWLAAMPALSGATLRIFYSFMVPIVGGRRWTVLSTLSLLIPAIGIGLAVQDPATPYWVLLLLAAFCGLGGGNFSSSMANISFFFPRERKGSALGLNAGLGNLGVSAVQFMVPLVISVGVFGWLGGEPTMVTMPNGVAKQIWLQNAGFVWVIPIVVSSLLAFLMMNDIADAKASFSEQAVIFGSKHNWIMSWLYLGTFGSFIGFSAGFPLLIKSQFAGVNPLEFAWMGPFLGALIRPVGGWLADRVGGARVTFWNFVAMVIGVLGVLQFLPHEGDAGSLTGFFISFMVLFVTAGIGNGSTFRMIPVIFTDECVEAARTRDADAMAAAAKEGNRQAAAVLGFTAALGAYGGFFIPKSYGTSIALSGSPHAALWAFIAFYVTCIAITWWFYARRGASRPC